MPTASLAMTGNLVRWDSHVRSVIRNQVDVLLSRSTRGWTGPPGYINSISPPIMSESIGDLIIVLEKSNIFRVGHTSLFRGDGGADLAEGHWKPVSPNGTGYHPSYHCRQDHARQNRCLEPATRQRRGNEAVRKLHFCHRELGYLYLPSIQSSV